MEFKTKYKLDQRLNCKIDNGEGFGIVESITIRHNAGDLDTKIIYQLNGEWSYKGQTFRKELIRTEKELDEQN